MKSYYTLFLFTGVCLLVSIMGADLWQIYQRYQGAQEWDMAFHTLVGAQFYHDVQGGHLLRLFKDMNSLEHWPFLHGLILAVAFFFTGIRDQTAVWVSLFSYLLSVLILFWIMRTLPPWWGREVEQSRSRGVGQSAVGSQQSLLQISNSKLPSEVSHGAASFMVALLALFSSELAVYGTLVMLEIVGTLITLFCLWMYSLYLQTRRPRYLTATAVGTIALIFTKYNYGIMWLVPFLIFQVLILSPDRWRRLKEGFLHGVRQWAKNPFLWGTVLVAAGLIGVTYYGGYKGQVAGYKIRMISPWNGLWVLAFLWSIWFVVRFVRDSSFRASLLRPGLKPFIQWVVFPCLAWFLWTHPNRLRNVAGFLESRPMKASILSWDNLWTYPKGVWELYHVNSWVLGISLFFFGVALIGTGVGLIRSWRSEKRMPAHPVLFLFLYFGINLIAVLGHHTAGSRFFITIMPVYWLSSGFGLLGMLQALPLKWIRPLAAGGLSAGFLLVGWNSRAVFLNQRILPAVRDNYSRGEIPQALKWIVQQVRPSHKTLVVGYFNQLSLHLIELEMLKQGVSLQKVFDHKGQWMDWNEQNKRISPILKKKGIGRVVVIEIAPHSLYDTQDYRNYFRQQLDPVDRLKQDPEIRREGRLCLPTLTLEAYDVF